MSESKSTTTYALIAIPIKHTAALMLRQFVPAFPAGEFCCTRQPDDSRADQMPIDCKHASRIMNYSYQLM